MTPAIQTMITEGLKVLGDFLMKGAFEAAKEVVHTLSEGVNGRASPEIVLDNLKLLESKVAINHAKEDKDLHDKYHPAGSEK